MAYGTNITNFTNFTNITLVAAVANSTNSIKIYTMEPKFSVNKKFFRQYSYDEVLLC